MIVRGRDVSGQKSRTIRLAITAWPGIACLSGLGSYVATGMALWYDYNGIRGRRGLLPGGSGMNVVSQSVDHM